VRFVDVALALGLGLSETRLNEAVSLSIKHTAS